MKKKRQRWCPGDVIEIDLGDRRFAYGRVLKFPLIAFYDLVANETPTLDRIIVSRIAFKIWVMKYAVTSGEWPVIGHIPLTDDLKESPRFFKKDRIAKKLSIYLGDGVEQPATLEEIEGLECAAGWDPEHVVDRLNDHFAGRPNKWVLSLLPDKSEYK